MIGAIVVGGVTLFTLLHNSKFNKDEGKVLQQSIKEIDKLNNNFIDRLARLETNSNTKNILAGN